MSGECRTLNLESAELTVTFSSYSSKVVIQPSNFIGCLYNSPWRVQGTNFTYPTNPNATYTGPYSNGTYVNGTFTNTTDGIGLVNSFMH